VAFLRLPRDQLNVFAPPGGGLRTSFRSSLVVLGVGLVGAAAALGSQAAVAGAAGLAVLIGALAASRTFVVRWETLVSAVVLVVLFVPIKRYKFVVDLPFDLELYRVVLALIVGLWILALLADRRVRLRGSFLDRPLLLYFAAILGSLLFNLSSLTRQDTRILRGAYFAREELAGDVLKEILFLFSFVLMFYFIVSVIRGEEMILRVLKVLVGGGAVVALMGIVEARTGYNLFDHLRSVLPILSFEGALTDEGIARGGRLRTYASAQHPIALATMLVMILPFAVYLARTLRRPIWVVSAVVIGLGAIATVSRTSVTTLAVVAIVYLWLRPKDIKRLWPALLPALILVHFALPGAIGGIQGAFFPSQGLIADQTQFQGRVSGERVGPVFDKLGENPVFGQGYGTRITETGYRQNAHVLDNEWLGTAAETGVLGVVAWVWFFARLIRRSGREAKSDPSPRGEFLVAAAAAISAFAVSMLTFDAFHFIQVTFVMYIIAALCACAMHTQGPWRVGVRVPRPVLAEPRAARLGSPVEQVT
jgi:polysaccharide biosynthesis protein PslJ